MEVYFIRHGIAVERHPKIKEEERELTAEGREKTQKVAKQLNKLGLHFELILTSPLVRSRQTAQILSSCGLSAKLAEFSALAPNGNIQTWLDWLDVQQMLATDTRLALVGHQPDLGHWAEILLWGEAKSVIVVKKAGIIGLKLPTTGSPIGRSQIFWLAPPKFLL